MGLGMSSAAWPTSLIAHLVREGFQVITPDNRDCGESSRCTDMKADGRNVASAVAQALLRRKVTSAYALEDMALDVERLLNHLSIRRAHIVGISMGGMIAQVAAVQSPNRVASLTSIASASGNPRTGFGRLNAVWTLLRKPDNLNTEEGLRDYFARVFTTLSGPAYKPSGEELESMLGMLGSLHYDPDGTARQLLAILASGGQVLAAQASGGALADHSRHGGSASAACGRQGDRRSDSQRTLRGDRGHGASAPRGSGARTWRAHRGALPQASCLTRPAPLRLRPACRSCEACAASSWRGPS